MGVSSNANETNKFIEMKKQIILALLLAFSISAFSQHFFETEFNNRKKYLILTNPTVRNIQAIQFLMAQNLLDIKKNKTKFVGVYHSSQKYDFSKSLEYIAENGLKNFFLHEINDELALKTIFQNNTCSDDFKTIFDNSIGVFFFGGPDIQPEIYGEENLLSVVTDPNRHLFEASFLFHLLGGSQNTGFKPYLNYKPDYMVTGFCLGMQTMNVATGGTLVQDIPAELYSASNAEETLDIGRANLHRNYWQKISSDTLLMGINLHKIKMTSHPFFGKTIKMGKGWVPRIYSSHHQSAEKLGQGFKVTALSMDEKVIEGIAHDKYPNVFAVQFHPEVPGLYVDLKKYKFHPDDSPETYHRIIGRSSVRFHKKYWEHISTVVRQLKTKRGSE